MRHPGGRGRLATAIGGSMAVVAAVVAALALSRGPIEPRAEAAVVVEDRAVDRPTTTTTSPPPTTAAPTAAPGLPDPHPGPPIFPTVTAVATGPSVTVYDRPSGAVIRRIPNPRPPINAITSFRVLDSSTPTWLLVQLPLRPNGATGWIRASEVSLGRTEFSIDIDLAAKWMTVYRGSAVVAERRIADGTSYTPTPVGEFYVSEILPGGGGAYGPWAFVVGAYSEVLTQFNGGDGQIALHGTNLPGLLGSAVSNGCVRMPNDLSQYLHDAGVPPGTPVRIHRG